MLRKPSTIHRQPSTLRSHRLPAGAIKLELSLYPLLETHFPTLFLPAAAAEQSFLVA